MSDKTMQGTNERLLTFRLPNREAMTGRIRNPNATLGAVASRLASKEGFAGTFEMISSKNGEVLRPDTRLADLPQDDSVIDLAPELTPAAA